MLSHAVMEDIFLNTQIFQSNADELLVAEANQVRIQWSDQNKSNVRVYGNYECGGIPFVEFTGKINSQTRQFEEMVLVVYNKGDAQGLIAKSDFGNLIQATKNKLEEKFGSKARKLTGGVIKRSVFYWKWDQNVYFLEYAGDDQKIQGRRTYVAEFLRLRAFPYVKGKSVRNYVEAGRMVSKTSLKSNIKKESNGDVFLDGIPMVDQGQKGYCVGATATRVLKFYGKQIDMHDIAMIAETDAAGGTNLQNFTKSLKKIAGKMNLKLRTIEDADYRSFKKLLSDYNRKAKRMDQPQIKLGAYRSWGQYFLAMDQEVWKATLSKSDRTNFQKEIKRQVTSAQPLLWSVYLGLVPEQGKRMSPGGHMRLIIGYNEQENSVIYSDSWGAKHTFKKMPLEDALMITKGLYYIQAR